MQRTAKAAARRDVDRSTLTSADGVGYGDEFEAFFTPENEEDPEIHGGFAWCHFVEGPEMDAKLKALKATVRCVPLDAEEEEGKCIFTGKPSKRRGVFGKAY